MAAGIGSVSAGRVRIEPAVRSGYRTHSARMRASTFLGLNRVSVDTATIQSGLDKCSESIGQAADISHRQQHGKQRSGTHPHQQRLPVDNDSITYQSPNAVSELGGAIPLVGSNELSFRVGRSITMLDVWQRRAAQPRAALTNLANSPFAAAPLVGCSGR